MSHFFTILYQDQSTPTWVIFLLLAFMSAKMVTYRGASWKVRVWSSAFFAFLVLVLNIRYVIGPGFLASSLH